MGGNGDRRLPVAPPRGERGLKRGYVSPFHALRGRSPSWGAWIETSPNSIYEKTKLSLPLVGSVD